MKKIGILDLFEELSKPDTSPEELLGGGVHIRTELGESGDFSVLSQIELHCTGDLFHGFLLGSRTDPGDGETDVDSWTDTFVEQFSLQEDLTVGNGNDVGGDISGHITSLGLDDGKSGQRTSAFFIGHFSSPLQKPGVEVEDITGVGFTAWGPPEEERHLPVSDGLFGKIVEDDDGVAVVVTEPLSHGATRVGSEVLEGSWVGSSCDDDDRVFEGIVLFEGVDKLGNGGLFLTDSNMR